MKFNPEDGQNSGPRCRNCHKGSSGCGACHNNDPVVEGVSTTDTAKAADNSRTAVTFLFAAMFQMVDYGMPPVWGGMGAGWTNTNLFGGMMPVLPNPEDVAPQTMYKMTTTSDGQANPIAQTMVQAGDPLLGKAAIVKSSRKADWTTDWRGDPSTNSATCSDDGLSWPHRTLGWKMLKDDLFGIDITGRTDGEQTVIGVGQTRTFAGFTGRVDGNEALINGTIGDPVAGSKALVTHDLDSVCLDCHNPTVWNATKAHAKGDPVGPMQNDDSLSNPNDNMDDETLLRGLP